jgi:hypothetical protein
VTTDDQPAERPQPGHKPRYLRDTGSWRARCSCGWTGDRLERRVDAVNDHRHHRAEATASEERPPAP